MIKAIRYILGSVVELVGIAMLVISIILTYVRDASSFFSRKVMRLADKVNRLAHAVAGEKE